LSESASTGWALQDDDNRFPVLSSIYFADSENGWIVGSRDTILHTDDGGISWSMQEIPSDTNYLYDIYSTDTANGWAAGPYGSIVHTETGGH
jgi:photosystem II stability/assembly factor-like uncharacterized protein